MNRSPCLFPGTRLTSVGIIADYETSFHSHTGSGLARKGFLLLVPSSRFSQSESDASQKKKKRFESCTSARIPIPHFLYGQILVVPICETAGARKERKYSVQEAPLLQSPQPSEGSKALLSDD